MDCLQSARLQLNLRWEEAHRYRCLLHWALCTEKQQQQQQQQQEALMWPQQSAVRLLFVIKGPVHPENKNFEKQWNFISYKSVILKLFPNYFNISWKRRLVLVAGEMGHVIQFIQTVSKV